VPEAEFKGKSLRICRIGIGRLPQEVPRDWILTRYRDDYNVLPLFRKCANNLHPLKGAVPKNSAYTSAESCLTLQEI